MTRRNTGRAAASPLQRERFRGLAMREKCCSTTGLSVTDPTVPAGCGTQRIKRAQYTISPRVGEPSTARPTSQARAAL
jgi:hypothetical protein